MIGIDEKHSIQKRNGKRIVICNGHFCDLDSISEVEEMYDAMYPKSLNLH